MAKRAETSGAEGPEDETCTTTRPSRARAKARISAGRAIESSEPCAQQLLLSAEARAAERQTCEAQISHPLDIPATPGRYGYRRITAVILRERSIVNHKTVQRLLGQLELKSLVRVKKYRAYRGEIIRASP